MSRRSWSSEFLPRGLRPVAALAALLSGVVEPADGTAAIVSCGNVDPALHARIVGPV